MRPGARVAINYTDTMIYNGSWLNLKQKPKESLLSCTRRSPRRREKAFTLKLNLPNAKPANCTRKCHAARVNELCARDDRGPGSILVYGAAGFLLAALHVLQISGMSEKEKTGSGSNTTHPLSFEELSDKAQERALRDWEPFTDWDWWSDTEENWYEMMREEYGIEGGIMQWDDSFSPWFTGRVVDEEKFIKKIVPGLIEKSQNKFMQIEYGLEADFWKDMYITLVHYDGRNPSSREMRVEIEDADEVSDEIISQIEKAGKEMIVDELRKLGGDLQSEWDYMTSWEAAKEEFASNDTKFNPDGSVYES